MSTILVLEDNVTINQVLTRILENDGYQVYPCFDAFEALKVFQSTKIDCVITDLMLPIMSGEEFIQEIRKESNVHIIIISAKTTSSDKLTGLRIGADDYLYKPFLEEEVRIKINNLFKKNRKSSDVSFNSHEVVFIEGKTSLEILGQIIPLTAIEYQMVSLLIQEQNKVITRERFLDVLYSYGDEVYDRVVDVHIRNIRKKIKNVYDKKLIDTVYGLGYCWVGELDE